MKGTWDKALTDFRKIADCEFVSKKVCYIRSKVTLSLIPFTPQNQDVAKEKLRRLFYWSRQLFFSQLLLQNSPMSLFYRKFFSQWSALCQLVKLAGSLLLVTSLRMPLSNARIPRNKIKVASFYFLYMYSFVQQWEQDDVIVSLQGLQPHTDHSLDIYYFLSYPKIKSTALLKLVHMLAIFLVCFSLCDIVVGLVCCS